MGKNIQTVSRWGRGSLEKRNQAWLSWHKRPKPFCDLSLATVLALEQVSVINNLKVTKECRNKGLLSGKRSNNSKDNKSVVKTPSSISMVKMSLKHILEQFHRIQTPLDHSTTRSTGTLGMIMLTFSDPHDFNQLKLEFCQLLPQFYAEFSFAQVLSWICIHSPNPFMYMHVFLA